MKSLTQFKKEMQQYFREAIDPEDGENFSNWFACLLQTLTEDNMIVKVNDRIYVKDSPADNDF